MRIQGKVRVKKTAWEQGSGGEAGIGTGTLGTDRYKGKRSRCVYGTCK